jgi:hypothetical protein
MPKRLNYIFILEIKWLCKRTILHKLYIEYLFNLSISFYNSDWGEDNQDKGLLRNKLVNLRKRRNYVKKSLCRSCQETDQSPGPKKGQGPSPVTHTGAASLFRDVRLFNGLRLLNGLRRRAF